MNKGLFFLLLFLALQFGCILGQQQYDIAKEHDAVNHSGCVGCYVPEEKPAAEQTSQAKAATEENETPAENENAAEPKNDEQETEINYTNYTNDINDSAENAAEDSQEHQQNDSVNEKNCNGPAEPDIFSFSSVEYGGHVYKDECVQWNTVKKYYCKNDSTMGNSNFNCPAGYWCKYGACIEFVGSCTDSDGNSTTSRGYVSIVVAPFASETKYDECEDEGMVREWVCNEEEGLELLLECVSGFKCREGKCVKSKCSEADGGFEPMIYSQITDGNETLYDSCLDDETLREYYCYGDSIRHEDVRCADTCIDDACMPKE